MQNSNQDGLEAWRRLSRRWDPATGGRQRNLLREIINPGRKTLEELSGAIEKWEKLIARYERLKGTCGIRKKVDDDIKMGALEAMCPASLETHLQMNRTRLNAYEIVREEVRLYLESKVGTKMSIKTRDDDPTDVSAFFQQKGKNGKKGKGKGKSDGGKGKFGGGKGKSKGKDGKSRTEGGKSGKGGYGSHAFQGYCSNCNKWGHKAMQCWSSGGGQAGPANQKSTAYAKDWKPKKGKGVGGLDEEGTGEPQGEPDTAETGGLELCVTSLSLGSLSKNLSMRNGIAWDAKGPKLATAVGAERLRHFKMCLYSGAAITALPKEMVPASCMVEEPSAQTYKTASGEHIEDGGKARLVGRDANGIMKAVQGRVADVYKPLVSATQVAKAGNDMWIGDDGGYMMKKDHYIAKALRKRFDELTRKFGFGGLTPIYEDKGTYNFDFYVPEKKYAKDLNPVGDEDPEVLFGDAGGVPSGFRRQVLRCRRRP